ncbi:major facilitator superfamily transporter [Diplodia corticola]|uniref:Efflux pump dotC n=1 Tax=Diplodia corticola TaxID=236234 RepID=A0A1J9QN17_9PEZI|nr:major facilitator superfamily transporter [Diplodia corticola]OJD29865.1 major facilitator superfamily transporter [Diplodia corticola]
MASPHDHDAVPSATALDLNSEPGIGASAADDATLKNVTATAPQDGAAAEAGAPMQEKNVGDAAVEPEKERSKAKIAIIMFALGMAVFLAAMDITIITTALPTISAHFHSAAGYTWIGSAFNLAAAASTPLWGKLSDIFGRKPVLLVANIVFFIGSLIAAVAVNIGMLIVARAIQGVGGGGLIILVNIVISDLFSMRSRGQYFGIIGMVWALASALGPVIGGALTQRVSWRWCFYINLPLDGLAFAIICFFLDVHNPRTPIGAGLRAIDWTGSLTVIGGTVMLLLGLEFGGVTHPWSSPTVVCLIVFGLVTIGVFLALEWKVAKYPIMPLRIFSNVSNLASLGVCFLHGFVFISATYYLPLYYQAVRGAGPILSGVYLLAFALSLSIVSAATGIVIKKTGAYLPCIIFGFVFLTLGFGLYTNIDAHSSWTKIILYQIVAGIGVGPNFQSPLIALQAHVHPRDIATATATFGFVRNLATAVSVVIGGVVFQNEMQKHQGELTQSLGPALASQLAGGSAGANSEIVNTLPARQREVAREAFADSLSQMWIVYVCFAGLGLLVSFLIKSKTLAKSHADQKAGVEADEEKRRVLKSSASNGRKGLLESRATAKTGMTGLTGTTVGTAGTVDVEKRSLEGDVGEEGRKSSGSASASASAKDVPA